MEILDQVQNDILDNSIKCFSSQWSDSGNDSVSNLGFEYENIVLNDYGIDFRIDSAIESVFEFHIDSDTEFDILSLILGKNEHQILLKMRPQIYPQHYGGNTTLPLSHFPLTAIRFKELDEKFT